MKILIVLVSMLMLSTFAVPAQARDTEVDFTSDKLKSYLERMGVEYKRATDTEGAYVLTKREGVTHADRLITLIVNNPSAEQLEIFTYPEIDGKFLNIDRLSTSESQRAFYEKLVRVNHKSFGMFFVDSDGDIGLRFTFSTENGIGFDAFRIVVENCQRVADRFTPTIISFMQTDQGY
ncbi:MAG: YbjN domain-containing protein [Acidobacteriota bacterium]